MTPIFVITTHHNRLTRHGFIKQELDKARLSYYPILAPDYNLFKHTQIEQNQFKRQSLTLAYYQTCQTAIFQGHERFIIMEDDCHIYDDTKLIRSLDYIPPDAALCYLTRTEHNRLSAKTVACNEFFDLINSNWWETPITLWTDFFAHYFISYISRKITESPWLGNIDHELVKITESGLFKVYGAVHKTVIGMSNTDQIMMSKEGSISENGQ